MNSIHILGATFIIALILYLIHCYGLFSTKGRHAAAVKQTLADMELRSFIRLQAAKKLPTVKRRALSVPHIALKSSYPPIK